VPKAHYLCSGLENGVQGRLEWIIDTVGSLTGCVSHRFFVKGGKLNGVPIKP